MTSVQSKWTSAFDDSTYALLTIPYDHHEIHEGSSFVATGTVDIAASGTILVSLTAPNSTRYSHAIFNVTGELETGMNLYEGFNAGTAHAGTVGVAVTAYNRNRNSSTAPTLLVYTGATVGTASPGTAGTLLWAGHWGSGRNSGGDERGVKEWQLKTNTSYLMEIRNFSGSAANFVAWEVDWYEHTDKE